MSVIEKIRNAKSPLFTFELLPPLKGHSIEKVYSTIDRLMEFSPAYINFTSHRNETVYRERPYFNELDTYAEIRGLNSKATSLWCPMCFAGDLRRKRPRTCL